MALCTQGTGVPPIGRAIGNTRVYVLNAQRHPVPIGVPGELYIGGVGVARGYLTSSGPRPMNASCPIRSAPVPDARMYRTGDLVKWRADGNLEYIGRIDNQVKIRGFRIELGEVETALEQVTGVKEAAVICPGR